MKYYLVKASDNYADEFDVEGFKLFTEEELSSFESTKQAMREWFTKKELTRFANISRETGIPIQELQSLKYNDIYSYYKEGKLTYEHYSSLSYHSVTLEQYFGTNEFLSWSSAEDYERCFTVVEITEAQYNTIKSVLGTTSFGETCFFDVYFDEE